MDGYEAMGFDVTQLTQDAEQSLFTIKSNMPIPMLVYGDAFQWAKYGHHILPSNLDLTSHNKKGLHWPFWTDLDGNLLPSNLDLTSHNKAGLHQTFWKSLVEFLCTDFLIEFLRTDVDGNLSFTLNPLTTSKLDHFLSTLPEGLSETANKDGVFDQHFLNENEKNQALPHWWDSWHCIVCNTDSFIHIHKFIPQEVWKAFNVGINAWNITAVLYSNRDRTRWLSPFPWRLFLIHLKVYEMSPAYYSSWFNWRHPIRCAHLLENESTRPSPLVQ